jgi:RNA polymerase sigma factor (sigma-70 family)
MDRPQTLAEQFELHRDHLRGVAYRMLGSLNDADDAVQEAWLRLDGADPDRIENLAAWLTTVVARICLDVLRARRARGDDLAAGLNPEVAVPPHDGNEPEDEAVLADSVGRALLVVLDRLSPNERIALVLHDMFAVPFDQIAPVVGRTTVATKKLASRARLRVRGGAAVPPAELAKRRRVVETFLAAARAGDLNALLAVLAPDAVRRADPMLLPHGTPTVLRGAEQIAEEAGVFARMSRIAEPALVDGVPGIVVAQGRRLLAVLVLVMDGDRVAEYDVVADPAKLADLTIAVLDY